MALDIAGWVEVRPAWLQKDTSDEPWPWTGAIWVEGVVDQSYDTFGCLFGVQNFAHFRPLAADRGVPRALSEEAARDLTADAAGVALPGTTWMSWAELRDVDWEERGERPDSRLHQYARAADESWRLVGKAAWDHRISRRLGLSITQALADPPEFAEGQEWEIDGIRYRAETLRRQDVLGPGWVRLLRMMALLAEEHGGDGVRLVVWFS